MLKKFSAVLLAGLLLLTACSNAVGQSEVEDTTANSLEELIGERPQVECPGDLDAEIGTEMTCVASLDGDPDEYEVYLVVTEVDNGTAYFDIEVDEQPIG
ncbi:DUF4333 domain-containing protein [Pseudactinotalea sp. Z1748]|uniref:DUF4333 domain-containing protein n=1 Tax=Pseudactinotalea sp. Z1748 TaxID=3413027 RepID=UPI003C7B4477